MHGLTRTRSLHGLLILVFGIFFLSNCKNSDENTIPVISREPDISPDYSGVTIPYNIAPLNFKILEKASSFRVVLKNSSGRQLSVNSSDGTVRFPLQKWRQMISQAGDSILVEIIIKDKQGNQVRYHPFFFFISGDPVDPWLCYRLLYPGYESWSEMKIVQRSTESFRESTVLENRILDNNCINCHTFFGKDPGRFFIHVRGTLAGTFFVNGNKVQRTDLRASGMPANAVYPAWHPSGAYIAFSSNKIVQSIHMQPGKDVEFFDVLSSLVIYNTADNKMRSCGGEDSLKYMETYPCWTPDGDALYYCRTEQVKAGFDYRQVRYDLVKRSFDQRTGVFGPAQLVLDANKLNKSISLPVISPDGCYMIFTAHDCGSFPVWHKESDLYLLDLSDNSCSILDLNSSETESWHSWSSNGKWILFSSKRQDGVTSRPYMAHFDSGGTAKPFVLPQKDPSLYSRTFDTFNRPEFITGRIRAGSRDFELASKRQPLKATW